jgi:hypothetical protein
MHFSMFTVVSREKWVRPNKINKPKTRKVHRFVPSSCMRLIIHIYVIIL